MTRTTPELAPPSPNFHATPAGGRLTTTYDLACNRPHTRRIFSGIGMAVRTPASVLEILQQPSFRFQLALWHAGAIQLRLTMLWS
ncbi:hypothetical protein AVEN_211006-1 [Araneus ventricosus]|uniref:Uncharacterized protein n=1 Tax=Araneus ventricosus TaxID=182803 RepID=A0A4Y2SAP7_ARAVE|nr:hypothetical protein AVEN_254655-1 [Araneus ventricosus]GBN85287.1 hypothetical protein AVEN_211006-1 [Araneus ventricosus]